MNMHTLKLGPVTFATTTANFTKLERARNYTWQAQSRIRNTPLLQYAGEGEHTISLPCICYPGDYGDIDIVDDLNAEAVKGVPLCMVSGTGAIMGYWVVKSVRETQSFFLPGGIPRKIEFTVSLTYYGDQYPLC